MGAGRRTDLSLTLLCPLPFLTWPHGMARLPDKESSSSGLALLHFLLCGEMQEAAFRVSFRPPEQEKLVPTHSTPCGVCLAHPALRMSKDEV